MKQPLLRNYLSLLFVVFCSSYSLLCAQESSISYDDICTTLRDGKQMSFSEISNIPSEKLEIFLKNFSSFLVEDDDAEVRLNSYRFLYLSGLKHQEFSELVVSDLVFYGLSDANQGNRKTVCEFLDSFSAQNFSAATKNKVANYAIEGTTPFEDITLLAARLNLTDLVLHFQHLLSQENLKQSKEWTLKIALGRLGDNAAASWCLEKVKSIGMNDQVIHNLLPDLIFMHHKPSIDFLLETILSDEKKCSSPNPDSDAKINCAYRIMELVAPAIDNFPIAVDEDGELECDDYEKALNIVREWINSNRNI
jgi:hypothetical protein